MLTVLTTFVLYTPEELQTQLPSLFADVCAEHAKFAKVNVEIDDQNMLSWFNQQGLLFTDTGVGYYQSELIPYSDDDDIQTVMYTHTLGMFPATACSHNKDTVVPTVREFLVGYGSMSDAFKKPNGHKTFIVVDDYTIGPIWDDIDSESMLKDHIEGVTLLRVIHSWAAEELWAKGGIVCPASEMLPVVFCIEHGKHIGQYITNATAKEAITFIQEVGCVANNAR